MIPAGDPLSDQQHFLPGSDSAHRAGGAPAPVSTSLTNRLTRLAGVSRDLLRADTVEAVAATVVTHGAEAVGAALATMTLLCDDEQTVRLVALSGGLPGDEETWSTFPLEVRSPSTEAIQTGTRVTATGAEVLAHRYPDMPDRDIQTVVGLPLASGSRTIGAIGLMFTEARGLDPSEVELLEILADTCAQSLERISAQQAAATQSAKLAFLADATSELASSLDYEVTLANVARLAVPSFADWCAIDVVDDGRLRRLAVAHVDPAKVRLAHELAERYPASPDASQGAWQVMRSGRSELISEVTDEMLVAGAIDEEHLAIARALRLRSAVTVPLVARDRVLGVMTWVAAESGRNYNADDLALAEDVANRAAISLDNADLHSQTLAAAVELQHAVLPTVVEVSPAWEVAHQYRPSGRTEVGGDFFDVIELDDGRLVMFVGDVMGRGVAAAAAMAHMRAAVRAYVALDPTPEVVLTRLDQMYARYQSGQLVTLIYLLADPATDQLVVANAGHPPPLLLRRDGTLEQLPFADGAPLGTGPEERRHSVVDFRVDETVVAFTDGLIERRGEDISEGLERLARAVRALSGRDLAAALDDLITCVGDPSRDDDVAILVARRRAYRTL